MTNPKITYEAQLSVTGLNPNTTEGMPVDPGQKKKSIEMAAAPLCRPCVPIRVPSHLEVIRGLTSRAVHFPVTA